MKITKTTIQDVFILQPKIFQDKRGYFYESWNNKNFNKFTNHEVHFVQDNHSRSQRGVLRGLHYQLKNPQGKLVRVVNGNVLDVVVDLRKYSPTFGNHITVEISDENKKQIWVPAGCAHGFLVLSEQVDFLYKTTEYYSSKDEQCILWNDNELNIDWKLGEIKPQLSTKDINGKTFSKAPKYE